MTGSSARSGPTPPPAQLQQRPAPREGGLFKRAWFRIEQVLPPDLTFARGWDLAATEAKAVKSDPDFTASVLIGFSRSMRRWYIVDVQRWREDPAAIERLIKQTADNDHAAGRHVAIELPQDPGQAGKAQGRALVAMLSGYDVRLTPQTGDKVVRSAPFASQASGGNISVLKADWNDDYLDELTGFPTGGHDDQVDATAAAFTRLTGGTTGLLDYYTRMIDEQAREKAERAAQAALSPVRIEQTHNPARALVNRSLRG